VYKKCIYIIPVIISIFLFTDCNIFEYSPYETDINVFSTNSTGKNLSKISEISTADTDSFTFALITDTHSDYDEFIDAVKSINRNPEILFVIHAGDMTDYGLQEEYKWANEIISKLNKPYLTVIGNHDCLSNGKQIYGKLFGSTLYTCVLNENDHARRYKFIFINDNSLEYDNVERGREIVKEWLIKELSDTTLYRGLFVVAHVPPFDDHYFTDETEIEYSEIMRDYNVTLSIHGHEHRYIFSEYYDDGVRYLEGDNIRDRNYCIITVYNSPRSESIITINFERIYF